MTETSISTSDEVVFVTSAAPFSDWVQTWHFPLLAGHPEVTWIPWWTREIVEWGALVPFV